MYHIKCILQVKVGELGPGDCIGEVLLKGLDVQSYKIVSTSSKTRIGWMSLLAVKGEVFFGWYVTWCIRKSNS